MCRMNAVAGQTCQQLWRGAPPRRPAWPRRSRPSVSSAVRHDRRRRRTTLHLLGQGQGLFSQALHMPEIPAIEDRLGFTQQGSETGASRLGDHGCVAAQQATSQQHGQQAAQRKRPVREARWPLPTCSPGGRVCVQGASSRLGRCTECAPDPPTDVVLNTFKTIKGFAVAILAATQTHPMT